MQDLQICFFPDTPILYKDDGKYAAGVVEGPMELVFRENLRKVLPGLSPLKPKGPDENWVLLFGDFEEKIQKRGVPITQWVDAFIWHSPPDMKSFISINQKKIIEYEVLLQDLYAAVHGICSSQVARHTTR